MPQFTINREPVGDVVVNTGYVVDLTATTTNPLWVGNTSVIAAPMVPDIASSVFAQRFAGGSGRNMIIENVIDAAIPSGWVKQFKNQLWNTEDGPFKCEVNADTGVLEFSDDADTIFTAPAGSIPIYGRFECNAYAYSGSIGTHEYIVDLGTATGSTVLNFEAYSVPDIFKVEYNGVEVINTGYRGDDGTYDGVPVTVAGPGAGSASFNKTTASPTWAKVIVEAPFTGTAWEFNLGCPGGASPPYIPPYPGTRITFTGTSTTYGNSLNGGTSFTPQIAYENGWSNTSLSLYPDFGVFSTEFSQVSSQLWSDSPPLYAVSIDDAGTASFYDHTDVIAIREGLKLIDPSGTYVSTAYGKTLIGVTDDFSIDIQMNYAPPINLYTYIVLDIASGNVTGVRGPFSEPTLPANTSTEKYIPISYSDGAGIVNQIHEGTLFWK
jgi:hypothetical protein